MYRMKLVSFVFLAAVLSGCAIPPRDAALVTTDHSVPHVSTVPGNAGQKVSLFVRQKAAADLLAGKQVMTGRVHIGKILLEV